ncbi:MAG: PEP-CTERM sorting domain-containing protein [Verrucomicrobia bacterium]|nr:PEP-CTERM sorting domain-containing protein [Verrucomicrobiota bacterium]
MKRLTCHCGLLLTAMAVMPCAAATINVVTSPGSAAPPVMLGMYEMRAFPLDLRAEDTDASSAVCWRDPAVVPPAAVGDTLRFNIAKVADIGAGWATWSHGYTGKVYFRDADDLYMIMPLGIQAFYMYVEPNIAGSFEIRVESESVFETVTINALGGAQYFGVWTQPDRQLTGLSIKQITGTSGGFAIGEFANNIPEPAALTLGAISLCGLLVRRRRQ